MLWRPTGPQVERYAFGECMYLAAAFAATHPGRIEAVVEDRSIEHAWFLDIDGWHWDIAGRDWSAAWRDANRSTVADWPYPFLRTFTAAEAMWRWMGTQPDPAKVQAAAEMAALIRRIETPGR